MNIALTFVGALAASHPIGAILGFVALRSMCVVYPPAPGLPMDLVAIGLFGPTKGFAFAEVGIMLGASIAFAGGRRARHSIGRSASQSRLSVLAARVARSVDNEPDQHQLYWWFTVRALTNPLFDPLSYAAGLARARFYPYFLGTLLGNIPSMVLFFAAEYRAMTEGMLTLVTVTALFCLTIWHFASRWLTEPESPLNA